MPDETRALTEAQSYIFRWIAENAHDSVIEEKGGWTIAGQNGSVHYRYEDSTALRPLLDFDRGVSDRIYVPSDAGRRLLESYDAGRRALARATGERA